MNAGRFSADLRPVLELLRAHAARPIAAAERATVAETIAFVEAHPDCLLRTCVPGHLTGSAWILSRDGQRVLLTHHRKLNKWLQLGGHADGDSDLLAVAWREAREESGLTSVRPLDCAIFDVDRHEIPARKTEPAHWHFDLRFVFSADELEPLLVTNESKDLAWVPLNEVERLNPEESMARMVRKTKLRGRSETRDS